MFDVLSGRYGLLETDLNEPSSAVEPELCVTALPEEFSR
jgi:hypothetical protein